jgi:cohesin complex subunit SA-1/2
MLTHYGRLGSSFDICAKVIVDILREEGMYNKNGEVVVEVISRALKEVCIIYNPAEASPDIL